MVLKWVKRLKWMRISKYALIITLLLSLVFAGFTVYGTRTGNFTIYLHGDDVQLAIYMKEDKSDMNTRLTVPTLDEMDNTTFEDIAAPEVRELIAPGLGSKNDNFHQQYLAFSFVLVNRSERMVNYDLDLTVVSQREGFGGINVVEAMRVLIIKEWHYEEGPVYESLTTEAQRDEYFRGGNFYALADDNRAELEANTHYQTEDFLSTVQLLREKEYDLEINAEVKYTVVFWLEGWDAVCVNALYGGRLKMRLDITGR